MTYSGIFPGGGSEYRIMGFQDVVGGGGTGFSMGGGVGRRRDTGYREMAGIK